MLLRRIARPLSNSMRVEKRFLAPKPVKPAPEVADGLDPAQAEDLDKDMCLLVDEKDNITGTATKRACHKVGPDGNVLLHRAFSVFLFNKMGDLLLKKRSREKVTYPNYFTNACSSHPLYIDEKPEDIITAARRRLNFEWGIPMDQMDPKLFTYMTRIHYHDPGDGVWGEHEIDHVLIFQSDFIVKPNSNEISEFYFVPKNKFDVFNELFEGSMTPWFNILSINHLLKLWWDNLHRLQEIAEPDKIHKFLPKKE